MGPLGSITSTRKKRKKRKKKEWEGGREERRKEGRKAGREKKNKLLKISYVLTLTCGKILNRDHPLNFRIRSNIFFSIELYMLFTNIISSSYCKIFDREN
jgi:hypothetical protein